MNIQTFFEAVFYVLDKLTLMFLAFVIIYASFKVGTKSHLQTAAATLFVVALSIFFVFTPLIKLVYYFVTGEPLSERALWQCKVQSMHEVLQAI